MVNIIKVDMSKLSKLKKFVVEMPKELDRHISKTNLGFMKAVRKSAKLSVTILL